MKPLGIAWNSWRLFSKDGLHDEILKWGMAPIKFKLKIINFPVTYSGSKIRSKHPAESSENTSILLKSENTFQRFNMEVYENIFLVEFLVFQVARENY